MKDGYNSVKEILNTFKILFVKQLQILDLSDDNSDEGKNSLMSNNIMEEDILVWMYSAFFK